MVCTENVLKHLGDEEVKKYVSRKCLKYFKNSKVHLDCHAETSHSLSFYEIFVAQEDQLNSSIFWHFFPKRVYYSLESSSFTLPDTNTLICILWVLQNNFHPSVYIA